MTCVHTEDFTSNIVFINDCVQSRVLNTCVCTHSSSNHVLYHARVIVSCLNGHHGVCVIDTAITLKQQVVKYTTFGKHYIYIKMYLPLRNKHQQLGWTQQTMAANVHVDRNTDTKPCHAIPCSKRRSGLSKRSVGNKTMQQWHMSRL